jgi:hypothetical protein
VLSPISVAFLKASAFNMNTLKRRDSIICSSLILSCINASRPSDTQFFPDQGAPHDQQYADRNRGKFYCHRSVSGFEGSDDGSRVAVVTLLIRLTDRRLATPPHQDVRPLAGGLRLPARSDHFISRSTSTQAEVAMTTFAARTSGNNFPHLRQSANNVPVSSRAIASISFLLENSGRSPSPPFCRFRPHAGVVTSGQTFAICCHADGRTDSPAGERNGAHMSVKDG